MRVTDLPLEDLAIGMFPRGAVEYEFDRDADVYLSGVWHPFDEDVGQRIHEFRLDNPVTMALFWKDTWSDSRDTYVLLTKKGFSLSRPSITFVHKKTDVRPFVLALPSWITFPSFYDQMEVMSSSLRGFRLLISNIDGMSAELDIWREEAGNPKQSFDLRVHAPLKAHTP